MAAEMSSVSGFHVSMISAARGKLNVNSSPALVLLRKKIDSHHRRQSLNEWPECPNIRGELEKILGMGRAGFFGPGRAWAGLFWPRASSGHQFWPIFDQFSS